MMDNTTIVSSDSFFPLIAVSAAALVGGLVLLQSDRISRRILDSQQLDTKRRGEYRYQWKTAFERTKLQLEYYFAGGIEKHKEDPECVMKNTTYISDDTEMDALVRTIVSLDVKTDMTTDRYYTLKIDQDPHDPTGDYFVFLARQSSDSRIQLYELPLIKFGMKLAEAFEDQLTTTTLCFVADASSGKASSLLEQLVTLSKTGVAVLSEPFWMAQLATLSEAKVFANDKIQKLLFALCRLDAWSVRNHVGDAKTVMITLPGQTTVKTLLPLVTAVFPEDRHLFSYDGCVASVQRAIYAKKVYKRRNKLETKLSSIIHGLCQDPVRYTTPLPSYSPLTKDVSLATLSNAFANVPVRQAQVVEAWMSSVDAYFKLKQDEVAGTNGYLPFCFKLGFLTNSPKGNFEPLTDSFWSLTALLQFITGCRSRALPEGVLDAAKEWLKDYNQQQSMQQLQMDKSVVISESERKMIENCCFQHKLILIGNKTLQDTVLPKEHWTLKQASRAGCSCCGPDPYDQMEAEEEDDDSDEYKNGRSITTRGIDMNTPGAFAMVLKADNNKTTAASDGGGTRPTPSSKKSGYVDGKMGFAFDPTRF
ncbi:hypothetical protein IV203_000425 [Nitzschia inconspicua]|uniref:Uncharacterized protein n=1 Tax=Nitzschia inconspicua TaxID=303405 RepID=A0A9K3PSH6_9STRA|nr:hypothetical protein IV203_000425 [Nitzschia inconspicua]